MSDTFDRFVVQIHMGNVQGGWQRAWIHGKSVVFRRNQHPLGLEVTNGLIAPVVSEFELKGFGSTG